MVKINTFFESSAWDTQEIEEKGPTLLVKKRATFTDVRHTDATVNSIWQAQLS
jgi:hypothetical protein